VLTVVVSGEEVVGSPCEVEVDAASSANSEGEIGGETGVSAGRLVSFFPDEEHVVLGRASAYGALASAREQPNDVHKQRLPARVPREKDVFGKRAYQRHYSDCVKMAHSQCAKRECCICKCEHIKVDKMRHGCVYITRDNETPNQIAKVLQLDPQLILRLNRHIEGLRLNSRLKDKTAISLVEWDQACPSCALAIDVCFQCGLPTDLAEATDVVCTGLTTGPHGHRLCDNCAPEYGTFCTARSRECKGPKGPPSDAAAKPHPFVKPSSGAPIHVCNDCYGFLKSSDDWAQEAGKEIYCRW
jgi:hypothetical protein